MRRLAQMIEHFEPLNEHEVATLLAAYSEEDCLARGRSTRSANTFDDAMRWARTLDEHRSDPAVSTKSARWMLDCLASLGRARLGEVPSRSPSDDGQLTTLLARNDQLFDDLYERIRNVIGRNEQWNHTLSSALEQPSVLDVRVARSKSLAALLTRWLEGKKGDPALSLAHIDRQAVRALDEVATQLDEALAKRRADKVLPSDSPAVNIAEGRLFFAMRTVWNDFARARRQHHSKLVLPVTPTILRGLDLSKRKKRKGSKGADEDPAES
jgi:hypothetical protein